MKTAVAALFISAFTFSVSAQETFTRKDSLHGGLRPERTSYDVQRYDLEVKIDPDAKTIVGHNDITFKTVEPTSKIQIDLFENMSIDSIVFDNKKLQYKRDNNAVFVQFPSELKKGSENIVKFYYSGKPIAAPRAPWSGGFDWKKDKNGKHFIGVAVQGTGASLWYPVKDSQTDEPDKGATVKVAVPNGLMDVSNGRFLGSKDLGNGYTRWDWEVKNPINTYDITVNIGDYAHIHDNYKGLDLDYYVLKYNEEKAKQHFEEVKTMMDCFQSKFGKYPFADDGYKLVETPYLGMEHQSAVAYGNWYLKGYRGSDLSGTGIGLTFDYIIIHETGHEWFGNSITSQDIADMWIHEGFTMYTEAVYVECTLGYDKAVQYMNGIKNNIHNYDPIIGHFGVNHEGSGDMYPKGAWLLHTMRHVVNDDAKWWKMLYDYSENFKHKIITTQDVDDFFSKRMNMDLTPIFNQYLRTTKIPVLAFSQENGKIFYKYEDVEPDFALPVDIAINGKNIRITPTSSKQQLDTKAKLSDIKVRTDHFLINTKGI
ncbi:M1 family metallopeptidase [Flavobacterium sp. MAH-1]|uniref:M1 family metallopeptidase n=1 Tax=Flavobacterium agri TaxID=2743471 RepID=A0A7Y8Y002_9FLAO|nr:M1 family metallopeptidase [Flavobacterium agri]NUY80024.1 M1 family metallopeptidase [Flavobacterium agri]NYA70049.1 M1 family metallopeptidase [Flavobacterium agri]